MSTTDSATVYVTGDVMIAHDILHPSGDGGKHVSYAPDQEVTIYRQAGGAWHMSAMLMELIGTVGTELVKGRVLRLAGDDELETAPQAHTLWAPFDRSRDDAKVRTFRVREYQGTRRTPGGAPAKEQLVTAPNPFNNAAVLLVVDEGYGQLETPGSSDKRHSTGAGTSWLVHKAWLNKTGATAAKPTAAAWNEWAGKQRSVAIVAIGALRGMSRRVGTKQSWQRTIREVQAALLASDELKDFPYVVVVCGCSAVLVLERTGGSGGAPDQFDGVAILHRGELEGEFADRHPGKIVGYGSCVTAHVVAALFTWVKTHPGKDSDNNDRLGKVSTQSGTDDGTAAAAIVEGGKRGLIAARLLQAVGYIHTYNMPDNGEGKGKAAGGQSTPPPSAWKEDDLKSQGLDTGREERSRRAKLIKKWTEQYQPLLAQPNGLDDLNPTTWAVRHWNAPPADELKVRDDVEVLKLNKIDLPKSKDKESCDEITERAKQLVKRGFKSAAAQRGNPYAQFGKLNEYDPDQIDVLCTLQRLLADHRNGHGTKPLSLAVFGPPGAGKSFTVKALAEALGWSEDRKNILEFNLSQLPDPSALFDALHQVASKGVKEPPLVFFDEFDTSLSGQRLGWLRYFLAPMQDGAFSVGTHTYQLGRPVLVFAGGTADSARDFGKPAQSPRKIDPGDQAAEGGDRQAEKLLDFDPRAAKLPDFLSRLRATLDIPSVNPSDAPESKNPPHSNEADKTASHNGTSLGADNSGPGAASNKRVYGVHTLRRALIVREKLEALAKQLCPDEVMAIDEGVLEGLLFTPRYEHGARSIEAILTNSHLKGAQRFTASLLPPRHLLELHTDAGAFMQLVERTQ